MRRVLFSLAHTLAILCLAMNTLAMPAEGASPNRNVRRPSYGVYVKTTTPDGKISYRYAYRGYESNFPPPAFLYYGYPGSGYSHGMGF